MSSIQTGTEREIGFAAEAAPSSRLRWSAILAGAVTFLSVGLLLWGLAFAIVSLLAHPWTGMVRGSALALWICAMGVTIVGAAAGGWIAGGAIAGARPGSGALHGFVTWAVALIAAFGLQLFVMRGLFTAVMFETAESAANGSAATAAPPAPAEADRGARVARDYAVGAGWSWFGHVAGRGDHCDGRRSRRDTWLLPARAAPGRAVRDRPASRANAAPHPHDGALTSIQLATRARGWGIVAKVERPRGGRTDAPRRRRTRSTP